MRYLSFLTIILFFISCKQDNNYYDTNNRHFQFEIFTKLKGSPAEIYDSLTGDISPW